MKTSAIAGLLASFAGGILACGDTIEVVSSKDPPVSEADAGTPPPPETKDVGNPATPKSCSGPIAPVSCPTLEPAPTSTAAISTFVKESAIPLRCGTGTEALWDVRPLIDLYGSQKIFMMGEVHGTNEIGIMSSIILEQLATRKLVNVVAFEMPADYGAHLSEWVATGESPIAEQWMDQFAPNMFASILTRTARDLVKRGIRIRLVAVDFPYTTELPIAAIQEIANKLTTQVDTVLATLPTGQPTTTEANAYFDHIMASKSEICAELTAADCDRLNAMTHALWVATFAQSGEQDELWFARREEVIYYNMKSAVPTADDRMFLHMGAAHTNKYEFSAGSRMTHEYELTTDKVFSVAPAYGDGSVIWYGSPRNLPGEPFTLTSALTDAPPDPTFVSTTRPSSMCETNPFGLEPEARTSTGSRGETYDGYIHYGKLTSEQHPEDTTFQRDIPVAKDSTSGAGNADTRLTMARFREMRARVEAKERAALLARAARR